MDPIVKDLGIPVKGVGWVCLHPGQTDDGKASLLATMSQDNGGIFVADIDLETGHCTQFYTQAPQRSIFPTATYRSLRSGILYICSTWDGHLHRFDANHPDRGIEDLGRVDDVTTFGNGITETTDGQIWIGSYPGARLTKYNPSNNEFTRFGRIVFDEEYLHPIAGSDGTLAAVVKANLPRVLAINSTTGESYQVGPTITDPTDQHQYLKLYRGTDDLLYLESHEGTIRISNQSCHVVENPPRPRKGIPSTYKHDYEAPLELPGGWTAQLDDIGPTGSGMARKLRLISSVPDVSDRHLTLDWISGGNNLHVIGTGPDGQLYGSSYLPNRLFHASPDGSVVEDLGKHTSATGQAYSLATLDGKLYLASSPGSFLSVYDPKLPLHFGSGPTDNPRDLGRLDKVSHRPNALISTPSGKLWMGSGPDMGQHGGTLAWYDPKTERSKSHRAILPNTSPASLLYLPELNQILIGLSIEAGVGTTVRRFNGAFAVWDPDNDTLVWSGDFGLRDLADVLSLAPAGNGLVYALLGRGDHVRASGAPEIRPRLALIDPRQHRLISHEWIPEDFGPVGWQGRSALRIDEHGTVYGATGYCIFRIEPGTCDVKRIWQPDSPPHGRTDPIWRTHSTPNAIDVVGPIIGNQFYFATGWRLRALTLPALPART